jgi:hypothetical protein
VHIARQLADTFKDGVCLWRWTINSPDELVPAIASVAARCAVLKDTAVQLANFCIPGNAAGHG